MVLSERWKAWSEEKVVLARQLECGFFCFCIAPYGWVQPGHRFLKLVETNGDHDGEEL